MNLLQHFEAHSRFQQASPIACGNVWETLDGNSSERNCASCCCTVYNLSERAWETLPLPQGDLPTRVCVVYEPQVRFRVVTPLLISLFCTLLIQFTWVYGVWAAASETAKPTKSSCQSLLLTPLAMPNNLTCSDAAGRDRRLQDWLEGEPEKQLPDKSKQLPSNNRH